MMSSDYDRLRRGDVLRLTHSYGLVPRIDPSDVRSMCADPVAAAALQLAEALDERDRLVAADPLDAIEDRGGWSARVAGLLVAYRAAKKAAPP